MQSNRSRLTGDKRKAGGTGAEVRGRGGQKWSVPVPAKKRVYFEKSPSVPNNPVPPPPVGVEKPVVEVPKPKDLGPKVEVLCTSAPTSSSVILEKLGYRAPGVASVRSVHEGRICWTWMNAECNSSKVKCSSIKYGIDAPRNVTLPLYHDQARTEQSYANGRDTLRDFADWQETHSGYGIPHWLASNDMYLSPWKLTRPLAQGVFDTWGSVCGLATDRVDTYLRKLVAVDSASVLLSSATQTRASDNWGRARYWVSGEKVGEKGPVRTRYSVVGETRPNWFSGDVKYRESRGLGELGPSDGLIYHCVELVAYLRRFSEFRLRSVNNLRVIQARGVQWCKEHGISDRDAEVFRAPSVIKAFVLGPGEFAAHQLGNSSSFANSVRTSKLLEEECLDPADDRSWLSWFLGRTPSRALLGDIQIYRPEVRRYLFGLDEVVPPLVRKFGVPYLGFQPWFRVRQLLTPSVSIPLR